MIRLAFLRRMALAAAACAFIDVPWPKVVSARTRALEAVRQGAMYYDLDNHQVWVFYERPWRRARPTT